MTLREKVMRIMEYILRNVYLNWYNLRLPDGSKVNDVVLFSTLSAILGKNILLVGDFGLGKTTLAEALNCLIFRIPKETSEASKLTGQPQQTQEKVVGRPHLAELLRGREETIWSLFAIMYPGIKIVDEISRFPAEIQNMLIHQIDRGEFQYLNRMIIYPKGGKIGLGKPPFIATTNPEDVGKYEISRAILDRFHICVEILPPIGLWDFIDRIRGKSSVLGNRELHKKSLEVLLDNNKTEEERWAEFKKIREEYGDYLKSNDIPFLTDDDIREIRKKIEEVEIEQEVRVFLMALLDEINMYPKYLRPPTANIRETPAGVVQANIGPRAYIFSAIDFVKGLAFLLGKNYVDDIAFLDVVLPYVFIHRVLLSRKMDQKAYQEIIKRINPEELCMRRIIEEAIINEFKRRFYNKKDFYLNVYSALESGDLSRAKNLLRNYSGTEPGLRALRVKLLREV